MLKNVINNIPLNNYIKILFIFIGVIYYNCNQKPFIYTPKARKKEEIKNIHTQLIDHLITVKKKSGKKIGVIPKKIPKNSSLSDSEINNKIIELINFLSKNKILNDDTKKPQDEAYILLDRLYKNIKDSEIIPEETIEKFEKSIENGCKGIKDIDKLRGIFDQIEKLLSKPNPKLNPKIVKLINDNKKVCSISDKTDQNNLLHIVLSISPKQDDIDEDNNKKNNKKNKLSELDQMMIDRLNIIFDKIKENAKDQLKAENKKGQTPLFLACKINRADLLLKDITDEKIIPLGHKDKNGNTPLHIAVKEKSIKSIKLLLSRKKGLADISNNNNETVLHFSGMDDRITTEILEHTKKINKKNISDGNTPLHHYVLNLKEEWKNKKKDLDVDLNHPALLSIKEIIKKGAKKNIKNKKGYTPYELLKQQKEQIEKQDKGLYKNAEKNLK